MNPKKVVICGSFIKKNHYEVFVLEWREVRICRKNQSIIEKRVWFSMQNGIHFSNGYRFA
jgi:hypothetical protein